MKRILALLLVSIMLLSSCGTPADTTAIDDATNEPNVTDAPETDAPATDVPETNAPETDPPVQREDYSIAAKGDAYVLNKNSAGDQSNNNFGSETEIHVKSNQGSLTRYGYLKFDISELAGDDSFTSVELDLKLEMKQNDPGNPEFAAVEIYAADTSWEEGTITFNKQPEVYSVAAKRDDIKTKGEVYSFAVTAYIRTALAQGKTEVAFYIKEVTETPLHLKFLSKESGDGAPKLSVYHGTKTDESTYEGVNSKGEENYADELSKYGLDTIVGLSKSQLVKTEAIEDTFVEAGTSAEINFGASEELDFKAMAGKANNYYRITLLKFDISSLKGKEFEKAYLQLACTSMEDPNDPTRVNVYGCFPYDWDEMSVTYNTIPEKEDFITSHVVKATGVVRIDITDYVKRFGDSSTQYISLYLEGDSTNIRRLKFTSGEGASAPAIILDNGETQFSTRLRFTGENPWDYAMENVSDWLNRWEVIKQGGDTNVETIEKINAEYALSVGATRSPNGAKTTYTQYPTRTVDTLIDFTENKTESELYDEYGGFMDESMKQEATGFFYTKKIGNRWWTIDPLGYPYFRVACVAISVGNAKQKAAMYEKYGDLAGWAQGTTDRMWELGYNSAGGWSSTANLAKVEHPISQTGILYVLKKYCQTKGLDISTGGNTTLLHDTLPVFDPDFAASVGPTVQAGVKGYEKASYVYGWMSDNELPHATGMLDNALNLDVTDERFSYSYATAWTFMYLKTGKVNVSFDDVTDELRREYRAMVYDRYFKLVKEALDRYAPDHQFMGCRFLQLCYSDEYVMRVAGYWCDVISYNYYGAWEGNAELLANQQKWAGKPVIITEWYAKGMDVWEKDNRMTNESGAGWTVKDQNDRGLFYQNYALQLLECKGCVGFDWFKYLDNDPDDLSADESNRNSNKGIVDSYASEYTELTEYMSELNNQKYTLIKFFDER